MKLAMLAAIVILTAVASSAVVMQASESKQGKQKKQLVQTSGKMDIETANEPRNPEYVPCPCGYDVMIDKSSRLMKIYLRGKILRTYSICLGFEPEGRKTARGDGRTPEGDYYICRRNSASAYYRSLLISYPSPSDAKCGVEEGKVDDAVMNEVNCACYRRSVPPQDTQLGGNICIHGEGSRYRQDRDWTAGCIAVTNREMAEIFNIIPVGTPVRIRA